LCKNNYYYTLATEFVSHPPPLCFQLITQALLIPAPMGTTLCPMPQLPNNPQALTVGVRVANGHPEHSVASATLASATALPPAALSGHVMSNFPHTLISLGLSKTAQSSSQKQQSQSTTQRAIQSSLAGKMRLVRG
jgi:hypothetical protein